MKRELGIARCGLACCLCSENAECKGCKRDGFLELSWCKDAEWCEMTEQYMETSGELELGFNLGELFIPFCEVMRFYGGAN